MNKAKWQENELFLNKFNVAINFIRWRIHQDLIVALGSIILNSALCHQITILSPMLLLKPRIRRKPKSIYITDIDPRLLNFSSLHYIRPNFPYYLYLSVLFIYIFQKWFIINDWWLQMLLALWLSLRAFEQLLLILELNKRLLIWCDGSFQRHIQKVQHLYKSLLSSQQVIITQRISVVSIDLYLVTLFQ